MYLNLNVVKFAINVYDSLTLTWDVFKYYKSIKRFYEWCSLTLTWDVFKCIINLIKFLIFFV